jgi:AbrB family looped-hinge helix DNA binding protein
MAKVTSKLQVTIPKVLAKRHNIEPGDEVEWKDAGDAIRLEPVEKTSLGQAAVNDRLKWFDDATDRQRRRQDAKSITVVTPGHDRGWTREELYSRGGAD